MPVYHHTETPDQITWDEGVTVLRPWKIPEWAQDLGLLVFQSEQGF